MIKAWMHLPLGAAALTLCLGSPAQAQVAQFDDLLIPDTAGGDLVPEAEIGAPPPEGLGPGEWWMARRDYASSGFSPLDQITRENADQLQVAWSFSTGELRGHEAAPIVVGDRMYIITPAPNRVFALDLSNQGEMLWSYHPHTDIAAQGVACCDVVNRGVAYMDGRIFFNTLDNRTIALDAETGDELWQTKLGDIDEGETMTMAPIVVDGKVIVGNSGADLGVRGWIAALDTETGEIVWRAYHTGPDEDILIDHSIFKPFYPKDRGVDLGVLTWPPDFWKIGGGTVWGWISYDPELDMIIHGTGNAGSWNPDIRPGDNKWTTSVFARRPADGKAVWAYQMTPHDSWDYDGVNEFVLADLPIDGEIVPVAVHFDRNAFAYTIDRRTGEVLLAEPFMPLNWSEGIDLETGMPIVNPQYVTRTGEWVRGICPAYVGGKDWQPSSFSPQTGLFYVPANNFCENTHGLDGSYISGTPYVNAEIVAYPGPGGHRGEFFAWDATTGTKLWSIEERFNVWSGTMVTAGDVAFYGTLDRWFKAVDAITGEVLWKFRMPSGVVGQPVSYLGPDGKQYIAVLSGVGGQTTWTAIQEVSLEDPAGGGGFNYGNRDLGDQTNMSGVLMVFALPDRTESADAAEVAPVEAEAVEVEPVEVVPAEPVEPETGSAAEVEIVPAEPTDPAIEVEPAEEDALP